MKRKTLTLLLAFFTCGNRDTLTQFITGYRRANAELITKTSKVISNHESN